MDLLLNNLTFAIIDQDGSWRTDLTLRFVEYFSHKINGIEFLNRIIKVESIDQALRACKTDYLLVQAGGHVTYTAEFFDKLDKRLAANEDIFFAHVLLAHDYAIMDRRCIVFNIPLWREHGSVPFEKGRDKSGPKLKTSRKSKDKYRPKEIIPDPKADREYVPGVAVDRGASIIIKQLDVFQRVTSLNGILGPFDSHFLDRASALLEIRSESEYEHKFLVPREKLVYTIDADDLSNIPGDLADIVVAPAQGLKAANLAEYLHASEVVIFDKSPLALELQRRIFTVTRPTTYGEIVQQFLADFPMVIIADDWKRDQHAVITPTKLKVKYREVDLLSYQAEDLLKEIDHTKQLAIDFSDIFVYPYSYYRKPLYQVQGLFGELYSLLKSRTGATYVLGYAPGYVELNCVEVNTSDDRYHLDPTIDPDAETEEEEEPEEREPIMFIPQLSPQVFEKADPLPEAPPIQGDRVSQNPIAIAVDLGFTRSTGPATFMASGDQNNAILLTKVETFDGFVALYEYAVNEMSGCWYFKVGTVDDQRKLELSNGTDLSSLKRHLLTEKKINPENTRKFFGK